MMMTIVTIVKIVMNVMIVTIALFQIEVPPHSLVGVCEPLSQHRSVLRW